ncbi:GNAT family N-acetyltransferase [Ignavibacterium sp.]|uniref:GNAT family N-acetyltransferase n=1 Tax=Ignavibacterium sp. TaxID=2651167 RepID=UPI00307E377A
MIQNEIKILQLNNDENTLAQIVRLHKLLFDKEHFTALFNEQLLEKYFTELLSKSSYKIAAYHNEEMVGYLIAGENLDNALKKFSKENFIKILLVLLLNPRFLFEKISDALSKFFYQRRKSSAPMRLFLIASKHNENIKGVGKLLVESFENYLIEHNVNTYGLSVRKHNKTAIGFYKKIGLKEEFRNHKSIFFIKKLSER